MLVDNLIDCTIHCSTSEILKYLGVDKNSRKMLNLQTSLFLLRNVNFYFTVCIMLFLVFRYRFLSTHELHAFNYFWQDKSAPPFPPDSTLGSAPKTSDFEVTYIHSFISGKHH